MTELLSALKTIIIEIQAKSKTVVLMCIVWPIYSLSFGQNAKIEVHENKGKIIGTQNNNQKTTIIKNTYINKPENSADGVLLLNKYLDTTKDILLTSNNITMHCSMSLLRSTGAIPIIINRHGNPLVFKSNSKGHLMLSSVIYSIDGKPIALLDSNRLNPKGEKVLKQTATGKFLEVIDENNIPVLRIKIISEKNAIEAEFVTFDENGTSCYVFSTTGMRGIALPKPYLLMTQPERDSFWYDCKIKIRQNLEPDIKLSDLFKN